MVRATSSVVIQCQSLTRVQIYLFIMKVYDLAINMIMQIHNHRTVKLESTVYSSSDLVTLKIITEVPIKFLNHVVNNQTVFLEVTSNCKSIYASVTNL